MLIPMIRSVSCNLRRITACVSYRNRTKTRIARYYNESSLLSTSLPNFASNRIYVTEPDSESRIVLPQLVDNPYVPSFLALWKVFYFLNFKVRHIDKDFNLTEFIRGARYATTVISEALQNKDYEFLQGHVTEDVIETLKVKIETLSPNQRQLIKVNESDMLFYVPCDIVTRTGQEHSIEITIICHYVHDLDKMKNSGFTDIANSLSTLICIYKFIRKYVDNVGGPWTITYLNHYSLY